MPRLTPASPRSTRPRADDDAAPLSAGSVAASHPPSDTAAIPPQHQPPGPVPGHIGAADRRPEFRISVRGVPAGPAPTPALLDDWFDAAVTAEAKHHAANRADPVAQQAVADAQANSRGPLSEGEAKDVYDAAFKAAFRPFFAQEYAKVSKTDATKQSAVKAAQGREKKRLIAKGRDPFTPLALGDPQARSKEVMLYEDADLMVIVDRFCPSPKALVVPKKKAMFPTELTKKARDKLAQISALASDAFAEAAGSQHADVWVNPPQRLSLSQLHVHVQPNLPRWEATRRARGVPPAPALVAEQDAFYTLVASRLSALIAAH